MCRMREMAVEKEPSRKIANSNMFKNSKKEGNHVTSEDRTIINESMELIYDSI
jgi:hypothetical protein